MDDKLLQEAIGFVQVGDKRSAINLLKEIVTKDPKNEDAWLWLAASFEKSENKIRSLKKYWK